MPERLTLALPAFLRQRAHEPACDSMPPRLQMRAERAGLQREAARSTRHLVLQYGLPGKRMPATLQVCASRAGCGGAQRAARGAAHQTRKSNFVA